MMRLGSSISGLRVAPRSALRRARSTEAVSVIGGGDGGEAIDLARRRTEPLPVVDLSEPQEAVVARKLRSAEEIAEREEQRAGARKRAKDLAAAPKQARVGRIRKWNNTHLGDAEQLEELTKR